jgi:hypothetical protein
MLVSHRTRIPENTEEMAESEGIRGELRVELGVTQGSMGIRWTLAWRGLIWGVDVR